MDSYEVFGVLTWILVAVYAAVLVFYLRAEKLNDGDNGFCRATGLKLILSCIFTVTAVVSYNMSLQSYAIRPDLFFWAQLLVVIGLACCIPGDFFLQYIQRDNVRYRVGIGCFLGAQVLFLLSLVLMNLLSGWVTAILVAIGILVFVVVVMAVQKWQLGPEKALITAYTVVLSLVAAKAFSGIFYDRTVASLLMSLGTALFLISDVILGIWNYGRGREGLKYANWITYFSGTMLIALSVNPLFDVSMMGTQLFG